MLFGDAQTDVFEVPSDRDDRVVPFHTRRHAGELLPIYARELDNLRNAFAQLTADYLVAIDNGTALRDTLLRADVRNRRSVIESQRAREAADGLHSELDMARTRIANLDAELSVRARAIDAQAHELSAQTEHIKALEAQASIARAYVARQAALLRSYEGADMRGDWMRPADVAPMHRSAPSGRWARLLRLRPGALQSCAPLQRS